MGQCLHKSNLTVRYWFFSGRVPRSGAAACKPRRGVSSPSEGRSPGKAAPPRSFCFRWRSAQRAKGSSSIPSVPLVNLTTEGRSGELLARWAECRQTRQNILEGFDRRTRAAPFAGRIAGPSARMTSRSSARSKIAPRVLLANVANSIDFVQAGVAQANRSSDGFSVAAYRRFSALCAESSVNCLPHFSD